MAEQTQQPSDDELWSHPERTYEQWGALMDVSDRTARFRLRRRGWVRKRGGRTCPHCGEHLGKSPGWAKAPCCNCSRSTPVEKLDASRLCTSCSAIPPDVRQSVRDEREAYRERTEADD